MIKRILLFLLCALPLTFCGCAGANEIDKSSIIETVTVGESEGKIYYSFYLLTGDDKPKSVSIQATSFEEACFLAEQKYIPNLTLSKLELFLTDKTIIDETLEKDIDFISEQPYFSPLMYVTLCDEQVIKDMAESKELPKQTEEHIILQKNKNKELSVNALSIFNNFHNSALEEFSVLYINSDKEIKALPLKITCEQRNKI